MFKRILISYFCTFLFIPTILNSQSTEDFIGSWDCYTFDLIEFSIELPGVDEYLGMLPSDENNYDEWDDKFWQEWLEEPDNISGSFSLPEHDDITLTFREDNTGEIKGSNENDPFLWRKNGENIYLFLPNEDEGVFIVTPKLIGEIPTFYLWFHSYDSYHEASIGCVILGVKPEDEE